MLIREPHDLDVVSSLHSEDGELLEAGVLWRIARFDLDVSYSTFENVGSFPFQLDRGFARLGFDLTDAFSAAVEYETHDYSEAIFTPADFDAERYGVFIRWRN
jgi:hypothetical protein